MSWNNGRRLFFGFQYRRNWICVVALNGLGEIVFRARFPLAAAEEVELDSGPAADIAVTLLAFARAFQAEPVCGTNDTPAILPALARFLGGPIRYVTPSDLEKTALPGCGAIVRSELGVDAHQRAILAALAVADPMALE